MDNLKPNSFQQSVLNLVEATTHRVYASTVSEFITGEFNRSGASCLRDHCTLSFQLPQRVGKSTLVYFLGPSDLVVFPNEHTRRDLMQEMKQDTGCLGLPFPSLVGVDNLKYATVHGIRSVWVMDPYWRQAPVLDIAFYQNLASVFKRPVVTVLLDSPWTRSDR